jgi:hypothetical protein
MDASQGLVNALACVRSVCPFWENAYAYADVLHPLASTALKGRRVMDAQRCH